MRICYENKICIILSKIKKLNNNIKYFFLNSKELYKNNNIIDLREEKNIK